MSDTQTQVDVADAIAQLTTGAVYQELKQYDREFNWFRVIFYGDSVGTIPILGQCSPVIKEDLQTVTTQLSYITWAAVNNPQRFMCYITEAGTEVPILVSEVCSELMNTMNYLAEINFKPKMKGDEAYFKRFGMYYAALRYFGKESFLDPYLNNADYEGQFYDCVNICYEPIEEFKGLIEAFYGITSKDLKNRKGGMILQNASFATDEWLKKYEQVRKNYFDTVAMALDILRNQPNLQMCINSVKIGDVYAENISNSTINNSYQVDQYVKCLNSATKDEEPEKEKEKPTEDKNKNKNENQNQNKDKDEDEDKGMSKQLKIALIVGSVVGVLLFIIFILVIVFKNKSQNAMPQPSIHPISTL